MELYAIKFGESPFYSKYIYRDMSSSDEKTRISWSFYLAKYNNKLILFDVGFRDTDIAKEWDITLINVENEVGNLIKDYSSVDIIFITHSHFDHIENLDLFKNASIIISKDEYNHAINHCSVKIKERLQRQNVITVDDEFIYDNKFKYKVIGGHSIGSSVIYFEEAEKDYVITGDECYSCDNLLSGRPIGVYHDSQKNENFLLNSYKKKLIPLPYHDLKVFEENKLISDNIVQII